MPKRRTDDVIHVVMTDHFIQRVRSSRNLTAALAEVHDSEQTAYRGKVVPYYPSRLPDELYLAVAQVNEGSNLAAGTVQLEAAIARHRPEEGMFYFELAEAYWKTGQSAPAVAMYQEALRRKPGLLRAIRNLGAALLELNRLEEAAKVLSQAPLDAVSLSNLGDVYRRQRRTDLAAQCYRQAIALDPDLPEPYQGLAQSLLIAGDTGRARDAFLEAIRIRPDFAEAHYNLGTLLGRQMDFAGAEKHLLLALKADPTSAAAHNNLGLVAAARGDTAEAIRRFRQALEVDPNNQEAQANLDRALSGPPAVQ
jgi:tetratricopeptide (TPR) repeat protein